MSTFIAPTPRNQNLKNLESDRVVFFRKLAGKLVENGQKHDLKLTSHAVYILSSI